MAAAKNDSTRAAEHPLLSKLAHDRSAEGTSFRGYVGPSIDDDHLTLYSSLESPSNSIEITRSDILHIEDIPESFLPFGAKVVWVRNDAQTTVRQFAEVRSGRLQMKVRPQRSSEDCHSPCSTCHGECSVCISICQYTPPTQRDPGSRRKKRSKATRRKYG